MSRLLLIAVIFAFASVAGASAAYSRAGQGTIVDVAALAGELCETVPTPLQVAIYKPCTKKLNGIAIPCPHAPQVLPQMVEYDLALMLAMPDAPVVDMMHGEHGGERQFRPPRG